MTPRRPTALSRYHLHLYRHPKPPLSPGTFKWPRPILLPQTPPARRYDPLTTRSDRIRIKTALLLGHRPTEIQSKLGYTLRQIQHAKDNRNTPQKHQRGSHKPKERYSEAEITTIKGPADSASPDALNKQNCRLSAEIAQKHDGV